MRLFYTSMSSSEIYPHSLHDALPISAQSVLALVYLALIGSVLGFLLYFWLVTKIDVTKSMLISLVIPVTALLIGKMTLNERLSWRIAAGSAAILAGIWLIVFQRRRSRIIEKITSSSHYLGLKKNGGERWKK